VSENQNVLMGKPVKAFLYQDHQSHIAVHMSAMQDPKIMSLLQNNPMAPQLQAAMMAHVNEHLGFEYRRQIEQQLGMSLPPQQDEAGEATNMEPEVEARLSPMLAQAAQRLLQQNQGEQAQKKAQEQAQDPLVQMAQQELQIKQADQQRKAQKDQADLELKKAQQQMDAMKAMGQHQLDEQRIKVDAIKAAAQMKNDKSKHMMDMGLDVLKHMSNQHHTGGTQEKDLLHKGLQTVLQGANRPTKPTGGEE
jgi:hypothetical protein